MVAVWGMQSLLPCSHRARMSGVMHLTLALAAGEQIGLMHFNTYNRSSIFSARLRS